MRCGEYGELLASRCEEASFKHSHSRRRGHAENRWGHHPPHLNLPPNLPSSIPSSPSLTHLTIIPIPKRPTIPTFMTARSFRKLRDGTGGDGRCRSREEFYPNGLRVQEGCEWRFERQSRKCMLMKMRRMSRPRLFAEGPNGMRKISDWEGGENVSFKRLRLNILKTEEGVEARRGSWYMVGKSFTGERTQDVSKDPMEAIESTYIDDSKEIIRNTEGYVQALLAYACSAQTSFSYYLVQIQPAAQMKSTLSPPYLFCWGAKPDGSWGTWVQASIIQALALEVGTSRNQRREFEDADSKYRQGVHPTQERGNPSGWNVCISMSTRYHTVTMCVIYVSFPATEAANHRAIIGVLKTVYIRYNL